jgi:hypothetical protein
VRDAKNGNYKGHFKLLPEPEMKKGDRVRFRDGSCERKFYGLERVAKGYVVTMPNPTAAARRT